MAVNRLELVEKYLDGITVVHSMSWDINKWIDKATWKGVMNLIPKWEKNYQTIYKMLNWYLRNYWDEFTISKDNYLSKGLHWGNTSKRKIYLMDKNDKVIFMSNSKIELRKLFWGAWVIDDIYSQIKENSCPDLAYVIEEDFYWQQYEVLVD